MRRFRAVGAIACAGAILALAGCASSENPGAAAVSAPAPAKDAYSITFDLNGGTGTIPALTVKAGEKPAMPAVPARTGYTFAGWFSDPAGGQHNAFNADAPAASDQALYAQWIPADHVRFFATTHKGKTAKLGYSTYSGITVRRLSNDTAVPEAELAAGILNFGAYKDLNGNGKLDPYEDWTLPVEKRVADLAKRMSYAEIAGLMLYSAHQRSWSSPVPSQAQATFLANDDLRHVLIAGEVPASVAAPWNNNIQALCESFGLGIPANNSSDPRHSAAVGVEYYSANTGTISLWPNSLGLAATFDPDIVLSFAKIASAEYRALGITTALSPQIDIATEPRWNRTNGTFGEDPRLAADMTGAYVRGFQGSFNGEGQFVGWGGDSVNAMIKHWPGGGAGEAGRDAHNDYGKYSVFPGGNFDAHMVPFVDGALQGTAADTTMATAVMPYYTISFNADPSGADLANAFSPYMLTTLLRGKNKFDGVICTDWGVDGARGWGPAIETLDTAHRSKVLIEAGVDQFGGQNSSRFILQAVELAKAEGTEKAFRTKMEQSAVRLLKNIFRTGLFENPYLEPAASAAVVAKPAFVAAGYDAQVRSIVMVKNHGALLPLAPGTKVYVPKDAKGNLVFRGVEKRFVLVESPAQADVAVVALSSPTSPMDPVVPFFGGGWLPDSGYFPLTLQYSEYTAVGGRAVSIAGDYRNIDEKSPKYLNRSYRNAKMTATNFAAYKTLLDTKEAMGDKPVVVVLNMDNPPAFAELDALAAAALVRFASSDNAVLDILSGKAEPSGLLPIQIPASMAAVERQLEDLPRDLACYVDQDGNTYDFAFGLNWKGPIADGRVAKYRAEPATAPRTGQTTDAYVAVRTYSLPVGVVGAAYSAALEARERGATYALVSGELPPGLSFAPSGALSGTPTAPTHRYGNQLVIKASAPGKKDRTFRITLLVNGSGTVTLADPNGLSIAITLANAKLEANYQEAGWIGFKAALDAAKETYAHAAAKSQAELDAAAAALAGAAKSLARK